MLQPGGIFVASTFLKTFSPLGEFLGDDTVRPLNQVNALMCLHADILCYVVLSYCITGTLLPGMRAVLNVMHPVMTWLAVVCMPRFSTVRLIAQRREMSISDHLVLLGLLCEDMLHSRS